MGGKAISRKLASRSYSWLDKGALRRLAALCDAITPSDTDPAIKKYNRLHYVLFNENTGPGANLFVFLTGTGGRPPGPTPFLHAAVDAGYRVISLDYNDEPTVAAYYPLKSPACSGNFRRMRIYGDGIYAEERAFFLGRSP